MQVEKSYLEFKFTKKNADNRETLLTQLKSKISILLLFAGVFHLNENTTSASKFKAKAVTGFILFTSPCFCGALELITALRSTGKKRIRTERMVRTTILVVLSSSSFSSSNSSSSFNRRANKNKKTQSPTRRPCPVSANLDSETSQLPAVFWTVSGHLFSSPQFRVQRSTFHCSLHLSKVSQDA